MVHAMRFVLGRARRIIHAMQHTSHNNMTDNIRLTEYSHGAGCGCKISPKILDTILASNIAMPDDRNLLVGNSSKDDAAAYDLGNGQVILSTTDFFMPIADDPFDFGRIAAQNAAEGGQLVASVATTQPRPPEPPREPNTPVPPGLRRDIGLMVERAIVTAGLVEPTFPELCALYGADQAEPEKAMGPDWDVLVQAISAFSIDPAVGHIGTGGSPALSETFPDALGPNAG